MKKMVDVFDGSYRYALFSVQYRKLENNTALDTDPIITDDVSGEKNDDNFVVIFKRSARFEPADLFEITVSFKAIFKALSREKLDQCSDAELVDILKNDEIAPLSTLASKASAMITHLTEASANVPLITSGTVIK